MAFGVSVGLQCSPLARSPTNHFFIRDELLDLRHAAGHAGKPIGTKHRADLLRIAHAVRLKELLGRG